MTTGASRSLLPDWWFTFTENHPALPTIIAVAGLVTMMVLLAPSAAHPTDNGGMIDSFSTIVRSETLTAKAITLRQAYHAAVPEEVRDYARSVFFNPALYLLVPFVFLLEYLFPAHRSQPIIGKGFWQDMVWFCASAPTKILVLGTAAHYIERFYQNNLSFMTIASATTWPLYAQVAAGLFVGEFLNWASHYIRHKVSALWQFHAVHHSQRELNVFTDDRSHFMDKLASSLLMFLPFYMFQVPNLYAVAVIGLCISIHSRFVHANVKINLGWLGWVVASPQFHRVHHSAALEHWDTNFGGVLSIFDRMFGTAYPSWDEYPDTGIHDEQFPDEEAVGRRQLVGNWLRQTVHPFVQVAGQMRGNLESTHATKQPAQKPGWS